jgi:hypothetical protein
MTWHPIETRPRDGSLIDVWIPETDYASGWRVTDVKCDEKGRLWRGNGLADLARWPSHWQPLPQPPEDV